MVTCWECDAETERPATVLLRLRGGLVRRLLLCPTCYRQQYLALASQTPAGTPDRSGIRVELELAVAESAHGHAS
jgi:hypothetical protein